MLGATHTCDASAFHTYLFTSMHAQSIKILPRENSLCSSLLATTVPMNNSSSIHLYRCIDVFASKICCLCDHFCKTSGAHRFVFPFCYIFHLKNPLRYVTSKLARVLFYSIQCKHRQIDASTVNILWNYTRKPFPHKKVPIYCRL